MINKLKRFNKTLQLVTGHNVWRSMSIYVEYSFCTLCFGVPHDDFVVHYIMNEMYSWKFKQHYKMADSLYSGRVDISNAA